MAQYIGSFTITVVCMVILSFILRALMPEGGLGKYVDFVIGIIVSITIAGSFTNVGAGDFENIIDISNQQSFTKEEAGALYNEKISESFKKTLAERVKLLVRENTGSECDTEIMLNVDTDGAVLGVEGIYVRMHDACDTEGVKSILAGELEVDEEIVHIGGGKVD